MPLGLTNYMRLLDLLFSFFFHFCLKSLEIISPSFIILQLPLSQHSVQILLLLSFVLVKMYYFFKVKMVNITLTLFISVRFFSCISLCSMKSCYIFLRVISPSSSFLLRILVSDILSADSIN